jgi:hypothetical protein
MTSELVQRILRQQENAFANAMTDQLVLEERATVEEYEWNGRVNVSSVNGFGACPLVYLKGVGKRSKKNPETLEKMLRGQYLHKMYQDLAMRRKDFIYEPDYLPEELKIKREQIYPEVPVFDPRLQLSGRIDLIYKLKGMPHVTDFKFTEMDPWNWKHKFEESLPGRSKYEFQIKMYLHQVVIGKLYKKSPKSCSLMWTNTFMETGGEYSKREVFYPYSDELAEQCETFIEGWAEARNRHLEGEKDFECPYKNCREHKIKV